MPSGDTCDAVWHSTHELSLWHVVHKPGSARASSACRDRNPARCSPASGTSSNAIFAGSVGTVPTPWHFAHERSLWQLEQRSRSLPARTPCSRIQSPSWTRWLDGRSVLGAEVDVARVAAAQVPLVLVLVTAEADGHLREERLGARLGDRAVAANAVSVDHGVVLCVLEAKVLAREPLAPSRIDASPWHPRHEPSSCGFA